MPKILTIVGARPQFVKAAALSRALKKIGVEEVFVHTGQHFDENMAEIFFRQMNIPQPKYNLGIHSLSHGAMTGRMLEEIEKVLITRKTIGSCCIWRYKFYFGRCPGSKQIAHSCGTCRSRFTQF